MPQFKKAIGIVGYRLIAIMDRQVKEHFGILMIRYFWGIELKGTVR